MKRAALDIHKLFSRKGSKFYMGDALKTRWQRLDREEKTYHVLAGILAVAVALIMLFR